MSRMATRSPRPSPLAFKAPASRSTRWPSSSKVRRRSPSQIASRSGKLARARGRMREIGNTGTRLAADEFGFALLDERAHALLVILGQHEHALPEPLEVAPGVHVGV